MEQVYSCGLNEDFIAYLADFFERKLPENQDAGRAVFVFSGKRPELFLKRELSRRIQKSFYPPRFFSIDEFVEYALKKHEPFSRLSEFDACFLIYSLAQSLAAHILKGRDSFSLFLPWAQELLSFIEQLDLECIPSESLEDIQAKAGIGYDVPAGINVLLKHIIVLRKAFHQAMLKRKTYSRGFVYHRLAGCISDIVFSEFDDISFCGLFYLNKSEKTIIGNLLKKEKARLFFQGDPGEWPVLKSAGSVFASAIVPKSGDFPGYKLGLHTAWDMHGQIGLVREIIRKKETLDKTVIVIPDPEAVVPLLSEISALVEDCNVSLGYPLRRSALYSLLAELFKAQETRKQKTYYTKDYLNVLRHPLAKNLKLFKDPAVTRVLIHKIEEALLGIEPSPLAGRLFVMLSDIEHTKDLFDIALAAAKEMRVEVERGQLKDALKKLHQMLFLSWEDIGTFYDFAGALGDFMRALIDISPLSGYPLNLKMAEHIFHIEEEFRNLSFSREKFPEQEIYKVFINRMDNAMVSFLGSPLKGLQVLGLYETRSLCFEHVIIMDVNEAVLPYLSVCEPLIPREVMISLGLNRIECEEEIQRYQFKRLISGAKTVDLVYQENFEKERSRFIEEIIWQRQKDAAALEVVGIPRARFKVTVLPKKTVIAKRENMLDHLGRIEYSASGMNTYLHCPLRFYYQYVLGLDEKEDLLDEPQARDIGTFIHELLEETFKRFLRKKPCIDAKFRKYFFSALDEKFDREFTQKMHSESFLIKEILDFKLKQFLDYENNRQVEKIFCLEKKFNGAYNIGKKNVRFTSRIDRIDVISKGHMLILDYKSGESDLLPVMNLSRIEEAQGRQVSRQWLKENIKSFQLPLYLYLVENDTAFKGVTLNAGIYPLKDLRKDDSIDLLFRKEEHFLKQEDFMRCFMAAAGVLIREILDPDVPFSADEEDNRYCQNCPFSYLCR